MNKKTFATIALATTIFASPFFANTADAASHTVQSGDTLWNLSQKYHTTIANIKTWNNLSSNAINIGQTLIISPEETYTVKSGDSLSLIAKMYSTTVSELKSLNGLTSDLITVGQVLKVFGEAQAPVGSNGTYQVVAGDSLSLIAKKYNTSVNALKTLNGLSSDLIKVGQTLKVPNGSSVHEKEVKATTYTVKAGDSLWAIAIKHGLTVAQLKSFNGLVSDTVYVGQVLNLQANGNVQAPDTGESFNVENLITEAKKHMGTPYVWGGTSPSGFDCSGFLHYVFLQEGKAIPRTVATIWDATTSVSSPKRGDLVFFETYKAGPSHAGIYLGDNKFIHASSSKGVTISDLNNPYWNPRYLGAKTVN